MPTTDTSVTVHRSIDASAKALFDVLSLPARTRSSTVRASSAAWTTATASPPPARPSA